MIQANTVITGDSLTVLRDMEADSVDMVITDPPYGIDYQSGRKEKASRLAKIANDKAPFIWWIYDAELPGKRPDDLIACAKVGNQNLTHPNEKPVALLEQLIEATTIPGALILDPFAGSGSTLAAAAKTGRQYIGIEIDEQYSKLAATRAAEHHQKGETT